MSSDRFYIYSTSKVEVIDTDNADVIGRIKQLGVNEKLSTLRIKGTKAVSKKIVDCLAALLNSNCNIKILLSGVSWRGSKLLLEALADGNAGDNLEVLHVRYDLDGTGNDLLARYLRRNRKFLCLENLLFLLKTGERMGEIGDQLGKCNSISSLKIYFYFLFKEESSAEVETLFSEGIAKMPCLTQLDIVFPCDVEIFSSMIYAIESVATGAPLEHFSLQVLASYEESRAEKWQALGSLKSLTLRFDSLDPFLMVLPQLQSCECLTFILCFQLKVGFASIGTIVSSLPKLRAVYVGIDDPPDGFSDDCLDMVMANNSISKVIVRNSTRSRSLKVKVDVRAFCLLNAEFSSTNSIGSSDLWARVLSKMHDGRARATFLYRLLREKPEWIVSIVQSPVCGYSKIAAKA